MAEPDAATSTPHQLTLKELAEHELVPAIATPMPYKLRGVVVDDQGRTLGRWYALQVDPVSGDKNTELSFAVVGKGWAAGQGWVIILDVPKQGWSNVRDVLNKRGVAKSMDGFQISAHERQRLVIKVEGVPDHGTGLAGERYTFFQKAAPFRRVAFHPMLMASILYQMAPAVSVQTSAMFNSAMYLAVGTATQQQTIVRLDTAAPPPAALQSPAGGQQAAGPSSSSSSSAGTGFPVGRVSLGNCLLTYEYGRLQLEPPASLPAGFSMTDIQAAQPQPTPAMDAELRQWEEEHNLLRDDSTREALLSLQAVNVQVARAVFAEEQQAAQELQQVTQMQQRVAQLQQVLQMRQQQQLLLGQSQLGAV